MIEIFERLYKSLNGKKREKLQIRGGGYGKVVV
jgi:hypothetical protein